MKKKKLKSMVQRKNSAASMALVVVCAGILILVIVACFQIAMLLGGTQELNYTADSAALNVAKRSMEIKTSPPPLYTDCADSNGLVGLANVNRVWGKAYLISANVEEMTANQQLTPAATSSADQSYALAQNTNNDLFGRLNNHPTLFSFFEQIASLRFLPMFGNSQANIAKTSDWATASVYRGDTSNLTFSANQVPGPTSSHCASVQTDNATYMQGYTPMQADQKPFYFVAFRPAEMPHLVSESFFTPNRIDQNGISNISNPLPNAFSAYGLAPNSIGSHAFAIANPQREYKLSIPHAFVTINVINTAFWIVQGKQVNITSYGYVPETQWGAKHIPLDTTNFLDGYASLGNEFNGNTLWSAMNSVQGNPSVAIAELLQKIQEIDGSFTQGMLQQLLQQQNLVEDVTSYVIYPNYTTPDNTSPNIKIAPAPLSASTAKALPSWLNLTASNEGQSKALVQQDPTTDAPNFDWEMLTGQGFHQGPHWTKVEGELDWQPGTGANQTLGQLNIVHNTRCYFVAYPNK